jgi:hypothetical protein
MDFSAPNARPLLTYSRGNLDSVSASYIGGAFRQRPGSLRRRCRAPCNCTERSINLASRRKLGDHQCSACAFAACNDALIGNMPRFCYSHQSRGHWAALPKNIVKGMAVSALAAPVPAAISNDPTQTPASAGNLREIFSMSTSDEVVTPPEAIATEEATPEPTATEAVTPESMATEEATPEAITTEEATPEATATEAVTPETTAMEAATPEATATEPSHA